MQTMRIWQVEQRDEPVLRIRLPQLHGWKILDARGCKINQSLRGLPAWKKR
jgi:hypothetical protein